MHDIKTIDFTETDQRVELVTRLFSPISLAEMDAVKLLDRFDTKFIFQTRDLVTFLERAKPFYRILEVENHLVFQYITQYFDTPEFEMYLNHHNQKLNRFKVRKREYCTTGEFFFEIKFKSNKGRTRKTRIQVENPSIILNKDEKTFLKQNSPYKAKKLEAKLLNQFRRITLVHKTDNERVTLDFDLGFHLGNNFVNLPFLSIAEIKKERLSGTSDLGMILKKESILPMKFSKYCMGSVLLNDQLKYNRFKTKLLTLNKLKNDSIYSSSFVGL
jgi:hypothetical protein